MTIRIYKDLDDLARSALMKRPAVQSVGVATAAADVIQNVADGGDRTIRRYTKEFDGVELLSFRALPEEIKHAQATVAEETRRAIEDSVSAIRAFHLSQIPRPSRVETRQGVECRLEWKPIRRVGLYVPGGSAPLVSTLLMLAVPAQIAGCDEIAVFTPPRRDGSISPEILFALDLLGIPSLFKIGGAQAIAAMAVGTESIPRVDKIFGPGNRHVAAAKAVVAQPPYNVAVDMIAGPTELLVVADGSSNAAWVAADLLSQAEHGADSQVILVTPSESFARRVDEQISGQLSNLSRSDIVRRSLESSQAIIVDDLEEAILVSNRYAPEHLVIATENAGELVPRISNAGSVFLGPLASVVFGDYASGTNHTLPTGGTAVASGGLTVASFLKPIFIQRVTRPAVRSLVQTAATLAQAEGLDAHAKAAQMRDTE